MQSLRTLSLALSLVSCAASPTFAQELKGSGSTFVFPVMAAWTTAYEKTAGIHVGYQPIGSSAGIEEVKEGTVDFGITDAPLRPEELTSDGLAQFPLVMGAIVPVIHLDGISAGELRLTGELLANIYLGKIRTWNDPAIAVLNPDVKLQDRAITVMHRADGSGTTFNWADYLSRVSDEWRRNVGAGTTVHWPTGEGKTGNRGVADAVKRIDGAIGYVEFAYVLPNKLAYALIQNRAGKFVQPAAESFKSATEAVDWTKTKDFYVLLNDAPGVDAYPIMATSFVLVRRQSNPAERTRKALAFFSWALNKGGAIATSLDYVAAPAPLVEQIEAYWTARIK